MQGLLERFMRSRRYPLITKLQYAGVSKPHTVIYHKSPGLDNGVGTITVRSHAKDSRTIGAWARRLDVPYSGQQLQTFTGLAIDTLLRRKQRRYLKDDEKHAIKEA